MTARKKTQTAQKTRKTAAKKPLPAAEVKTVHYYILLDRSGSMESMRDDVVGGFNAFLEEQRRLEGRARVTLVQFDSQDPQETLLDAVAMSRVQNLHPAQFCPRGGTPLLDATARLISTIHGRQAYRKALSKTEEEVVFITVTDGEENQSRHATLEQVKALVENAKELGWSFVFLGAGIDAYGDAERLGYDTDSVQAWRPDGTGARSAWHSVSRAGVQLRSDVAAGVAFNKADYFRGIKEAELES
jgi:Mg-chelatase subunit ChlD